MGEVPARPSARATAAAVAAATALFGGLNAWNAWHMAPNWGQDLAFFTQIVASAARGGRWSSPLLLEPEGFFAMVHTHLVLPLVVAAWRLVPRVETLLVAQALFASLALVPARRLGAAAGGPRLGWAAVAALVAFGPFQALATADFRPVALFLPGVLGVWAAAWEGRWRAAVGWGLVALAGRQEASYLLGASAAALLVLPWGGRRRWRTALAVGALAAASLAFWVLVKPWMFHHFDPLGAPAPPALPPEDLAARRAFGLRLARSGWVLGLAAPAPLLAALPVVREMLRTAWAWQRLAGPSAHYAAFWLPFAAAAGIAGAGRLGRRLGRPGLVGLAMVLACGLAFPPVLPREGAVELRALANAVGPADRVAADYDTIHLFAGRQVLWNVEQIDLPESERPWGWTRPWPITLDAVDVVVAPVDHPIARRLGGWRVVARAGDHAVFRR